MPKKPNPSKCCVHCTYFEFESTVEPTKGRCTLTGHWVRILMRSCEYFKEHAYVNRLRRELYRRAVRGQHLYLTKQGESKNVC